MDSLNVVFATVLIILTLFTLFLAWSIRIAIRELSRSNDAVMAAVKNHSGADEIQHGHLGTKLESIDDKLNGLAKSLAELAGSLK